MATLDRLGPPASTTSFEGRAAWTPRRAIAVALTVAAAIALFQVVMSSSFTYTGQKLQRLEAQRTELQAQTYQMEAEVAALASLERTERIARERLGMVPAKPDQYITVTAEAPAGALLPRPLVELEPYAPAQEPRTWWQEVLAALPRP